MRRISIRFDENTLMLLSEVCEKTDAKLSVVVRTLIRNSLSQITDPEGHIRLSRNDKTKK